MAKTPKVVKQEVSYDAKDIVQLPYPTNIQKRPQMYIGTTNSAGMLTCIREILNNSVDEHLAGYCDEIVVERLDDFTFRITDNGRGVPFGKHDSGGNALEVIFGELHSGRNFETKTVYSTGINGVGSACVNALSSIFQVEVYRGKKSAAIEFQNGIKTDLEFNNVTKLFKHFKESSTSIAFELNQKFFKDDACVINEDLETLLKETAYLNSGLKIGYINNVTDSKETFEFNNGVVEYLKAAVEKPIVNIIGFESDIISDTKVEVAFTYNNINESEIASFCNTINTSDGGTHVTGFKRAISQKLLAFIKENNLVKEKVTNEDIYGGLNAIVSVFVFEPTYTSQTKTKLDNTEVAGHVISYFNQELTKWLDTNPADIKIIAKKIDLTAKARIAQKRALEGVKKDSGNSFLSSLSSIDKFSDCKEQMSGRTELYLVEGDSAGGTVTNGRDKAYQAVYRLKGKVLNTVNLDSHKIRNNKEIDDLISVLRCGIGRNFDIEKLKFNKVITLCDADSDGKHIELLLSTLVHEHLRPIVEAGMFYISVSPLYKVSTVGKPPLYLNTADDLAKFITKQLGEQFLITDTEEKALNAKDKLKAIKNYLDYQEKIEFFSDHYSIDKTAIEKALLMNFDQEGCGLNLGKRVEINELETGDISIIGFYIDKDSNEEFFISITSDDEFIDRLSELQDLLIEISTISFINKTSKDVIDDNSYIELIDNLLNKIKRNMRVSRLKGLGEMNPDELWDTSLNPETRRLIRVELLDDAEDNDSVITNFMGKDASFRKEFLKGVFKATVIENDD